ncbi:MAG: S-layer homology domain-containing protein [Leptolyngbyaceae cyanobacterium]
MGQLTLFVHPINGQDIHDGSSTAPLKTLYAALRRSEPGTVIQLAAGQYTAANGERFPLQIPSQRRIVGPIGATASLQGSGAWRDSILGLVEVTCVAADQAQLENLTIINPEPRGIGLWMDTGRPIIQTVTCTGCDRYGMVILDDAIPTVLAAQVSNNGDAGVALLRRGKGALVRLQCRQNNVGIALSDQAAPLIQNCDIQQNQVGVAVTDTASPVLRNNQVRQNQVYGLRNQGQGAPDLGRAQDQGLNVFRDNGQADIHNQGPTLISCGNDVVPQHLFGSVALVASEIPAPVAVPAPLLAVSAVSPEPEPPNPSPEPPEPAGSQRFTDMANHWAGTFVDGLAAEDLVKGFLDGSFRPNQWVTRAQFAALVAVSYPDRPQVRGAVRFTDVARDFWAAAVLDQAQRMGFLSGFPDGTMRPNQSITRVQAMVAIANGLSFSGGRVDALGIYRDRAQIPSYAVSPLATATQRRLVVNYPDALTLRPAEPITRAEVAALVYQGRVALGLATEIASPYIVRPDTTQVFFSDLTGHWASAFILGLATNNLVSGMADGQFLPDAAMNRAQYAALVVKAFQPTPDQAAIAFRDVSPNFWAAAAIQQAFQAGFVAGFPDQTFGPDHPLLRVQIWVSLVNGLSLADQGSESLNILGRFQDYTDIPRYALQPVATATRRGLIVNYPDVADLRPNQVATRAEVCAAVYQALVALGRLPAIATQ